MSSIAKEFVLIQWSAKVSSRFPSNVQTWQKHPLIKLVFWVFTCRRSASEGSSNCTQMSGWFLRAGNCPALASAVVQGPDIELDLLQQIVAVEDEGEVTLSKRSCLGTKKPATCMHPFRRQASSGVKNGCFIRLSDNVGPSRFPHIEHLSDSTEKQQIEVHETSKTWCQKILQALSDPLFFMELRISDTCRSTCQGNEKGAI